MADFLDSFGKQIDVAIKDAVFETEQEFKKVAQNAFDEIQKRSPIWSGYYKSNHRVTVRSARGTFKTGGVKLVPSTKPEFPEALSFIDNVEKARAEELAKIDRLELGDTFEISTIVPYADEVEIKHRVYSAAEAIVKAST